MITKHQTLFIDGRSGYQQLADNHVNNKIRSKNPYNVFIILQFTLEQIKSLSSLSNGKFKPVIRQSYRAPSNLGTKTGVTFLVSIYTQVQLTCIRLVLHYSVSRYIRVLHTEHARSRHRVFQKGTDILVCWKHHDWDFAVERLTCNSFLRAGNETLIVEVQHVHG